MGTWVTVAEQGVVTVNTQLRHQLEFVCFFAPRRAAALWRRE